ncbi:hypothetical protein [Pantoea ananatis]|uniref:hypothetical protein n=1 Tax=Pantoea ananas TaxID=553 RepID=UPI001B301EBC|nr:hypothetical protein [Pantoea ananatis]
MKIYDTNYGPDTFGRIRMGLITEMFLTFEGYLKPEVGDHLRISCLFKDIVRDVYTVVITKIFDCMDETETVLIQVEVPSTDKLTKTFEGVHSPFEQLTSSKVLH